MADQYEFSADEELAMRRARRADPAKLAQVDPGFAPAAAVEAREDAAARLRRGAKRRSSGGYETGD